MKIPNKIKVGGHIFKVTVGECDNMGETDFKKNTIKISGDMTKDQQEATFIHEVFHTLNTTWGAREHNLLDSLSEQWYAVLSENKLLK